MDTKTLLTRRHFFGANALGLGTAALASLLPGELKASATGALPGLPHFAPKAKRVLYLFQSGGPSQMELFDYKPKLKDYAGTELPESIRNGQRHQVIDHLICCALIEGRSCEKFQVLARELANIDAELAAFYASLVESEGNHYATYILMARAVDDAETDRRLDYYLGLDAALIRQGSPLPILH